MNSIENDKIKQLLMIESLRDEYHLTEEEYRQVLDYSAFDIHQLIYDKFHEYYGQWVIRKRGETNTEQRRMNIRKEYLSDSRPDSRFMCKIKLKLEEHSEPFRL